MRTWVSLPLLWIGLDASTVSLKDLSFISKEASQSLLADGVFILSESIDTSRIRDLAVELNSCSHQTSLSPASVIRTSNIDSSFRATFATQSGESFEVCSTKARELAEYYKQQTQSIGEEVSKFLDAYVHDNGQSGTGSSQRTLENYVSDSETGSLDHFHVYSSTGAVQNSLEAVSVPFHTDMGLLLVLTPGIWVGPAGTRLDSSDLKIRRADGVEYTVDAPEDSVIIILGSGLVDWLYPDAGLRAGVHAVNTIAGKDEEVRVVLGRMFLPPMDTVSHSGVVFSDFFHKPIRGPEPTSPIAAQWRRLSETRCAAGKKYCWMNCMPEPDCDGDESICMDPTTNLLCGPTECNTQCTLVCPPKTTTTRSPETQSVAANSPGNFSSSEQIQQPSQSQAISHAVRAAAVGREPLFCQGATSMVMTGFESVGSDDANCIILFFKPWLLDTPMKFTFGCIGVFLLGMLIEGAIRLRRFATASVKFPTAWLKELAVVTLFALNVALGYLAMLAAMTFNVEIFISTVMGLAVGHLAFANSKTPVRESADPCCVTAETGTPTQTTSLRNSTGACCCDPS